MRILITGGSGFIGHNLLKCLAGHNYDITVTATGSERKPDVDKILYTGLEGIDWTGVCGQDILVHLAANNDTTCHDEREMFRANLYGPIRLFHAAKEGGCKKFIYASSAAVYGASNEPFVEGVTPEKPLNVYGDSKRRFDDFAMSFAEEEQVQVVGLRFCNVYGPGENHKGSRMSMIGQLMQTMFRGESPVLFKPGDQRRDWIYINDAVQAVLLAISYQKSGIFNIGTGVATSFNDVVSVINKVLGSQLEPTYIDCPFPEKYQSYTCCNIKKAQRELGLIWSYDLNAGIEHYSEYLNAF